MSGHDEIAKVNAEFSRAFDETDIELLRPLYTDDAWFMVPHADPLKGKDAILAGVQGLFDSGINAIGLKTTGLDLIGDAAAIETG
ncbi:MAG TPA: nuclear transport factor 2 family protein, partial [Emcibacteraceae bacterium]|nr:nuclear transport factor 2 family protein [Emcibacteraceae bacterium]